MDDLISRQAAIDALGEEPGVWSGKDEYAQGLNNQWHYDISAIKALPAVQLYTDEEIQKMQELEQAQIEKAFELGREDLKSEIIHCKYCKHRILNENYGKKGYLKEIKAICELDSGDPFELGRNADDDEWYCADAERITENK